MPKQVKRDARSSSLVGVSTSADVRAFKAANTALVQKTLTSKSSARTFVKTLEQRSGIAAIKKK